jgi:hypothetical protein
MYAVHCSDDDEEKGIEGEGKELRSGGNLDLLCRP